MVREYLRFVFSRKRTGIIALLILIYPFFCWLDYRAVDRAGAGVVINLSYTVYSFVFSIFSVTFFLIPLFLLFIGHNAAIFENFYVMTKYRSYRLYWAKRMQFVLLDCLLFVLITHMSVMIFLLIKSGRDVLDIPFVITVAKLLPPQVAGYMVMEVACIIVSAVAKRNYAGFFAVYLVVLLEYTARQFAYNFYPLITFMYVQWGIPDFNSAAVNRSVTLSMIYLVSSFSILCVAGYQVFKRRDVLGIEKTAD